MKTTALPIDMEDCTAKLREARQRLAVARRGNRPSLALTFGLPFALYFVIGMGLPMGVHEGMFDAVWTKPMGPKMNRALALGIIVWFVTWGVLLALRQVRGADQFAEAESSASRDVAFYKEMLSRSDELRLSTSLHQNPTQ